MIDWLWMKGKSPKSTVAVKSKIVSLPLLSSFKSSLWHSWGGCCCSSSLSNYLCGFLSFQNLLHFRSCSWGNSRPRRGGIFYQGSPGAGHLAGILHSESGGWLWGNECCHPPANRLHSGPEAGTSMLRTVDPLWPPQNHLECKPSSPRHSSPS